jgi:hypothetical protein
MERGDNQTIAHLDPQQSGEDERADESIKIEEADWSKKISERCESKGN